MIRPWPYIAIGILIAAFVAGSLVGLEVAAFITITGIVNGSGLDGAIPFGLLATAIASIAFVIGLIFPGIPILLLLYSSSKLSWRTAPIAGALSASVAGVGLSTQAGWYALVSAIWLVLPGAVAGLIVRAFAYRQIRPLPPQPPARPS